MDDASRDAFVEDRIAQLQVISERRNALLRQMYYMVHRRDTMGSMIRLEENDGDEGLEAFMDQFDLGKHPDTGTIDHFDHTQLAAALSSRESSEPEPMQSPPAQRPVSPPKPAAVPQSESEDELDLIGTPGGTQTQSRASSSEVGGVQQHPPSAKYIAVQRADGEEPQAVAVVAVGSGSTNGDRNQGVVEPLPIVLESPSGNEDDVRERGLAADEAAKVDLARAKVAEASSHGTQEQPSSGQVELTPPTTTQLEPESLAASIPPPTQSVPDAVSAQDVEMTTATLESKASPTPSSDGESMVIDDDEEEVEKAAHAPVSVAVPPVPVVVPATPVIAQQPVPAAPSTPKTPASIPQPPTIVTPRSTVLTPEATPVTAPPVAMDVSPASKPEEPANAAPNTGKVAASHLHGFEPNYTLPPLKIMSADFSRKSKPGKQLRKHKDKNGAGGKEKDDWAPLGVSRWGALLRANPVHTKLARAPKCLSTRDWGVAMSEIRLVRALDRIEMLKEDGRWSFRQPKKQRGVGGLNKTHWDYLLDEMKWMRTDFREERKWKLALAYNISTAVLEWHCFSTHAERVAEGICVGWRRPKVDEADQEEPPAEIEDPLGMEEEMDISMEEEPPSAPPVTRSLLVDYGSDDDDDDEQEKQSVVDALEPASALEEALDAAEKNESVPPDSGFPVEFKRDSEDPTSAASDPDGVKMEVDEDSQKPVVKTEEVDEPSQPIGLKDSSSNPSLSQTEIVAAEPGAPSAPPPTKSSSKNNIYAPLREYLAYADPNKLFLDSRDVEEAMKHVKLDGISVDAALLHGDLSHIFPDLPPFAMTDIPGSTAAAAPEGRPKRSEKRGDRDDPNKRVEETTYTKLFPVGRFMHSKPTLVGALQPAKRWKNGEWIPAEDCPAFDVDTPPVKIQDSLSELFNAKFTIPPKSVWLEQQKEKENREREAREREAKERSEPYEAKEPPKRTSTHIWTAVDDNLLRSLVDKYPNNWPLIAECYNSAHVSISTDTRTARDCHDRWKDLAPRPIEPPRGEDPAGPRGVKRLASASISGPSPVASGSDAKKRRRHHFIVDSIRKVGKKRAELAQKVLSQQRKPSAIHETHAQYTRLPKYTPAELSRMKVDKEAQELATARRKHEELNRAAQQQRLSVGNAGAPGAPQPQPGQPQAAPQQTPHPTGTPVAQTAQPVQPTNGAAPSTAPSQAPMPVSQQQPPTPQQQQAAAMLQAHQQRLAAAARQGIPIAGQQRVASPMTAAARMQMTPQMIQERMRQQAAAAQQTLIHHQQQQALLAQQAVANQVNGAGAVNGARAGTSSPRPGAAQTNPMQRQYMNVPGLQNYTPEQIAQILQMANQTPSQLHQQPRQ
uniref:Vacuolar import and degradation protein 21 n=1 Tax=Mycena chlorophos TaxID=658473 RepID=A0ABQ0M8G7_MYCCL|nr:predicted protein [Mycena chlorophos]